MNQVHLLAPKVPRNATDQKLTLDIKKKRKKVNCNFLESF